MRIVRGVGSAVCAAAAQASFLSSSSVVVRLQHAAWLFRLHHRSLSATSRITTTTLSSASQNNNNKDRSFSHPMIAATGSFREKLGLTPNPLSQTPTPIPLVIGHRGSLYEALENTRQSFQRCIEMGCNGFELDVYVIADGTLVIFHGNDSAGRRLGDFSEYCDAGSMISSAAATSIVDLTYQECQQLRFNPNFAEFTCPKEYIAGSRIPTLEEVLKDVQNHNKDRNNKNNKMTVKIELKGPNTVVPVLELVERLNMVDVCCYSSFDLSQLKLLRALRPSKSLYPTGALFAHLPDDFIQKALDVGATEIHIRYDDCTLDRIAIIHQHGLGSMAWMRGPLGIQSDCSKYADVGNEDERMYQALLETGVQQLCVNKPNVLLEMLRWNPTTANVRLPKAEE